MGGGVKRRVKRRVKSIGVAIAARAVPEGAEVWRCRGAEVRRCAEVRGGVRRCGRCGRCGRCRRAEVR
eukprot:4767138-Prymnesium_polylepis.1